MVNIPHIKLKFLRPRDCIASMTLRPTRYTRSNLMTASLLFAIQWKILHQKRTRPYQRHITLQHIYQLRQLVYRRRAHKPTHLCQSVCIRQQITLRILLVRHRLKLNDFKDFAIFARTLLQEESPCPFIGEMQPNGYHYQDWAYTNQCYKRNPKIKESFKKMFVHIKICFYYSQ